MSTNGMRPVHPGEILREDFLEPLGMSVNTLSGELHVPASRLNDIALERRGVTPDTALRLARYFGTSERFWLNLQVEHDLRRAQMELGDRVQREVEPRTA